MSTYWFVKTSPINKFFSRHLSLAHNVYEASAPGHLNAPVVIMHGLFGSKQNNRGISKRLAQCLKTTIYALDLRNHGDSPHHPIHDYSVMADDVEEFIQQRQLIKPILIGHSMGAKVAMTVALRSPQVPGALISVDNVPLNADLNRKFQQYIHGLRCIEKAQVRTQVEADSILSRYERALPVRQFLLTNLVRLPESRVLRLRIPIEILASSLGELGDFPFYDPDEHHFDSATLFIRGTQSGYVTDDALPLVRRYFTKFELCEIDSGHWVISERPDAFRQAVVDFIEKVRSRECESNEL